MLDRPVSSALDSVHQNITPPPNSQWLKRFPPRPNGNPRVQRRISVIGPIPGGLPEPLFKLWSLL